MRCVQAYDRNGRPIDDRELSKLFAERKYQILKQEKTPGGVLVSTVWLGYDHRFGSRAGLPIIFETMAFRDGSEVDCVRTSTEAQALAAHREMVRKYGPGVRDYAEDETID